MILENIANTVLFGPLNRTVNNLYIITAYATPNMLSWYIGNLQGKIQVPLSIALLLGMVPFDGISVSAHDGFIQLLGSEHPNEIKKIECSYLFDPPAVHSNVFIWAKDGEPILAYSGSVNFVQSSLVGSHRKEVLNECDPILAMEYYNSLIDRSIYATHPEIEEYVVLHATHDILDRENHSVENAELLARDGYESIRLRLTTKNGEPGKRSGLNWGQRPKRNSNEAYIPLPVKVAKSGFFPLEGRHFTVITDDRRQLILRIEQQNNKAITTPARNSDLGEYFRNRLGVANGEHITRSILDDYGRTDVTFIRLDEETYYMDFSPRHKHA